MNPYAASASRRRRSNGEINKLDAADRPVHDWYRFVLSFPPHLVRDYADRFQLHSDSRVLDPFCGTGTTLVECKKLRIPSVGLEANPMAAFASRVKVDWTPDPDRLLQHARTVADRAYEALSSCGIEDDLALRLRIAEEHGRELRKLPPEEEDLLLGASICPLPLHKALTLRECLDRQSDPAVSNHEWLALARTVVQCASNLEFGPEVGVGPPKGDTAVVGPWLDRVAVMADDLRAMNGCHSASSMVFEADARRIPDEVETASIDAVITSPPYPNEKDYTRTTRLESVLLRLIRCKEDLQALKRGLIRSNTRGVYKGDDDHQWVSGHREVQRIADAIEQRRVSLGKTSGFERLYPRVTRLYFGGMARHLASLRRVLKPGARLAYVVGDQASYLRIMIRTGRLLADLGCSLGYELERIDLFRTRLATATREQLREEVVVLRWPGDR